MKWYVYMLLAVATAAAQAVPPAIERTADAVTVRLDGGVRLVFATQGDLLLGLNRASVAGVELTSPETCLRPYLAREFGPDRLVWALARLKEAQAEGDGAVLDLELLATADEAAFRSLFVYEADPEAALRPENVTPDLAALRAKAEAAEAALAKAMAEADPKYAEAAAALQSLRARPAAGQAAGPIGWQVDRAERDLGQLARRLRPKVVAASAALRLAEADLAAFGAARAAAAACFGRIHRDFYGFAHTRLPAEAARLEALKALAAALAPKCRPAGSMRWTVRPETRNVAGWPWVGWRQHYEFALAGGRTVNCLRQLGTWELGGTPARLTAVNMRYRGLGLIEQDLGRWDCGVPTAFSTTEVLPGAAGESYAVSPKVPDVSEKTLTDRGYALRHRAGAWIAQPARGGGVHVVDFQYRPEAALAAFPERQGGHRALTEAFPGDRCLSQTDIEVFASTDAGATTPMVYLALVTKDGPLAPHESRSRWQEMDQDVRDRVAGELSFVQHEPLPTVGLLWDVAFASSLQALARNIPAWADAGVRKVLLHNPGWINGRSVAAGKDGTAGIPYRGGGVCNVYDWVPMKECERPWKDLQRACAARGVAYYVWLAGMSVGGAAFTSRVGLEPKHWALNVPGTPGNDTYGLWNLKHNVLDERCRGELLRTLEQTRATFGYQGFWADSFQNLFMSQLDWASGTGDSMQRRWWEVIAAWTRQGIGWMAESQAVPGLSCSIEVVGWEDQPWFFPHTCKWYRGGSQRAYTAEQLDRQLFRVMANKGWTAPDGGPQVIPAFARMAKEYNAALPAMRRPYILGGGRGVLWLPFSGEAEGVWFAFEAADVPVGVHAAYVLDQKGGAVTRVEAQHTYRVRADDLLARLAVRRGPLPDPRLGRTYQAPACTWPEWAKEVAP